MSWVRCGNTRFWKNTLLTSDLSGVYADPVEASVVLWHSHPEPGGPAVEINVYSLDSKIHPETLEVEERKLPKRMRFSLEAITSHFTAMVRQGKKRQDLLKWFSKRDPYVRDEYLDALFRFATALQEAAHRGERVVLKDELEDALFDVGVVSC